MAYFQGGDFVELLSAQGKSPAASWKLQGKISKTFDKGIKGNAFTLDGSSETKMQLPKTTSSSLGLAQRFVVLQLLVPFTRSFSVEICFSDFQKVRRRFVVASAFRDTARTTLHVQLPLNAADVPRDQWMNLVFDLQTLSEIHFPDTGYRSMESVCVSGSCRLKRIFTMKDAPTPSRGSQDVRHADIRDIPRQFVFSATQRGASGALPIPTLYFAMESGRGVGIEGVAVIGSTVSNATPRSTLRSQTAPMNAKTQVKGGRAVRPASELHRRKTCEAASAPDTEADKPSDLGHQRLRAPARMNTTGSNLRQPQSKLGKVVMARKESYSRQTAPSSTGLHVAGEQAWEEERNPEFPEEDVPRSVSPAQVNKSNEAKEEEIMAATSPAHAPGSKAYLNVEDSKRSQSLRQSIMGEIQQKIASLEADDERADQRDRELFLRHTSLHNGEWRLQQLRNDDLSDDDGALHEDDHSQLSSSWRRELTKLSENPSPPSPEVVKQRLSRDTIPVKTSTSHYNDDKESIFSFSSLMEAKTASSRTSARLFDFDSLLQDVKPLTPLQSSSRTETGSVAYLQLEARIENALADVESDSEDLELTKLLAAKRSARRLPPQTVEIGGEDHAKENEQNHEDELAIEKEDHSVGEENVTLSRDAEIAGEKDGWVVVEKDAAALVRDTTIYTPVVGENKWHAGCDEDSDIDLGCDVTGLSMDLTSELSASGGESEQDGDYEKSVGCMYPIHVSPQTEEHKLESDHGSTHSRDDGHDDSSFDFEDLVDEAELSDSRDEKEEKLETVVTSGKSSSQQKTVLVATRLPEDPNPKLSSSPQRNQLTHEKRRGPPVPPRKMAPAKSPVLSSPQKSRQQDSFSTELSSSFSSRRLQRLLESTDWTAELNMNASSSPHRLPSARSSDRQRKSTRNHSPDVKPRSLQKPSSRPQTPSTSSIELVYDPLLRCYYDPVANKYYALAE